MSFASTIEEWLRGRPHVGVVMHFEGLEVPALAARLKQLLDDQGLSHREALEQADGAPVFNAVASVAIGEGMELWIAASEKQNVGCKLELRLFHAIEESAEADEYLARFSKTINA